MKKIAAIIPYFQTQRGILRKALASINAQTVGAPIRIIVIDDASPIAAQDEVDAVPFHDRIKCDVIQVPNAGPGAARNRAMDALQDEALVTFLDSDDAWLPDYLEQSFAAVNHGFDYVAGNWRDHNDATRLYGIRHHFAGQIDLRPMGDAPFADELITPLSHLVMRGPICSTNVVTLSRQFLSRTRFDEDLRTAGEDTLFGARLAAKGPRVALLKSVTCETGLGVNIFSSGGWHSDQAVNRLKYQLIANKRAMQLFRNDPFVNRNLRRARSQMRKALLKVTTKRMRTIGPGEIACLRHAI